jgi:hypothetical protein
MVLVSHRAAPPHLGQVVFTHDSIAARGDSPVPLGAYRATSGSITGN